jgi:ABC-type phosphate transport system substrate-binding protein
MLTRGPFTGTALLALAAVTAAGCGGSSHFENKARPPTPVQLTGVITDKGVTISPDRVGAGPIRLLISNQTQDTHTITLDGSSTKDTVGPINPLDTATLQQTLKQGSYKVEAGSSKAVAKEVKAATLNVGPPRRSSSDQVLLP